MIYVYAHTTVTSLQHKNHKSMEQSFPGGRRCTVYINSFKNRLEKRRTRQMDFFKDT